jgi:hypothetical protein
MLHRLPRVERDRLGIDLSTDPAGEMRTRGPNDRPDPVNSTSTANSASFQSRSCSVCTSNGLFALILHENLCSGLP